MIVKLIESVTRNKNIIKIIATIENNKNQYLGSCEFFLPETDSLPQDEDVLCFFLEDLNLDWVEYSLS